MFKKTPKPTTKGAPKRSTEPRHFTHGTSGAMADAAPDGAPAPRGRPRRRPPLARRLAPADG